MLLSNAHVCETPQLVCITRSMTKYSNKNHSYRNSRNLPKNYEFTLINTKAPNTPITHNANDEQVLRTERVLYTQCNQSTNQKSCTFYCQNPSNCARILFASSGGIHSHLHTQNRMLRLFVRVFYSIHTYTRQNKISTITSHSLAQRVCMTTSCCLLSHCRCGCISSRTVRITNCKKAATTTTATSSSTTAAATMIWVD